MENLNDCLVLHGDAIHDDGEAFFEVLKSERTKKVVWADDNSAVTKETFGRPNKFFKVKDIYYFVCAGVFIMGIPDWLFDLNIQSGRTLEDMWHGRGKFENV